MKTTASLSNRLQTYLLYILPHHLLSRLMLRATRIEIKWWKNGLIRWVMKKYDVKINQAVIQDPAQFPSFNAFFTRELQAHARPLQGADDTLCSPVDGTVSQLGEIQNNQRIIQAKEQDYTLLELLGGQAQQAQLFEQGAYHTIYLSPRDYHRIHMPLAGRLTETIYIPGRLFSVAPHTVEAVPRLFARNERLVALFDTEVGPMAVILVGAIFVACIETVWDGVVTPPHGSKIRVKDHRDKNISLARGEEMGRFNMGSTVILLFGKQAIEWKKSLKIEDTLHMGQQIGHPVKPGSA
ncbi:MAG: phosphatidylserine decarboxylase [Gammaproteobacteria bacterium]|nr:phosphatidylserine decarboxylase [Gammaproteobacteria bacterium]